jgi:hypothetical protein
MTNINNQDDSRIFTATRSNDNDNWGRYQELVMKTLERLEDDIKTLQERYRNDINSHKESTRLELEKMRIEINNIREEITKTVYGMETQLKISDIQKKLDDVEREAIKNEKKKNEDIILAEKNAKFDIFLGGTTKFGWLVFAAILSFVFALIQIGVKFFIGA